MSLTESQLSRLSIVLVRARDPNNIGAAARAMYDFGFRDLRLVNEYAVPFQRAKSAVDASTVLESAKEYTSVADAIADCTLIVGTTAVGLRRREHPLLSLAEANGALRREMTGDGPTAERRVALLFGSEKTGLSNEELSHCHWLLTIPMHETRGMRHASMNLGQAVAVCLYEIVREQEALILDTNACAAGNAEPPLSADLERLTLLFMQVMDESGYSRRHPANFDVVQVRRLVRHMSVDRSHALAWTGILRQILWKLRGKNSQENL